MDLAVRLNVLSARAAQTLAEPGLHSDGGGLYLQITEAGVKSWIFRYKIKGKVRTMGLGPFHTVSLAEARQAAKICREQRLKDLDPIEERDKEREKSKAPAPVMKPTFGDMMDQVVAKKKADGLSQATIERAERMARAARVALGKRQIDEITAAEVLDLLRTVESKGHYETTMRLRWAISEAFRTAIVCGHIPFDPTTALHEVLAAPDSTPRAALVRPAEFGGLLRAIETYSGAPETTIALRLLALTFVRPGELRAATWSEFDFDAKIWAIPATRMKMRREHHVPLATQAIALLRELGDFSGTKKWLFPAQGLSGRCMSENTLNGALRRLGFGSDEMTAHGFRSAASTILNETGKWNPDAIEVQLAHLEPNKARRVYQRALFWDERVRMMQVWADMIDAMRKKT